MVSALLGWVTAKATKKLYPISFYPFHDSCFSWHRKPVFITLRNRKVYVGILRDYTKDVEIEPAVRILPIHSGYRDWRRKVCWTFHYPVKSDTPSVVIPYKEIVTFSLWDPSDVYTDAPRVEVSDTTKE